MQAFFYFWSFNIFEFSHQTLIWNCKCKFCYFGLKINTVETIAVEKEKSEILSWTFLVIFKVCVHTFDLIWSDPENLYFEAASVCVCRTISPRVVVALPTTKTRRDLVLGLLTQFAIYLDRANSVLPWKRH